jgi:hypothetical protein
MKTAIAFVTLLAVATVALLAFGAVAAQGERTATIADCMERANSPNALAACRAIPRAVRIPFTK